jgi:hypothetical protein
MTASLTGSYNDSFLNKSDHPLTMTTNYPRDTLYLSSTQARMTTAPLWPPYTKPPRGSHNTWWKSRLNAIPLGITYSWTNHIRNYYRPHRKDAYWPSSADRTAGHGPYAYTTHNATEHRDNPCGAARTTQYGDYALTQQRNKARPTTTACSYYACSTSWT